MAGIGQCTAHQCHYLPGRCPGGHLALGAKTKTDVLMEPSIVHTLSVRGLAVGYGKRSVAGHIAFDLDPGLLCGIVGVNGIGKSTLLRTLAGFQPKLAGEIKIWDRPLESISAMDLARQLSVVLTEQPASKNLSVHELIALGRQPHTDRWGMLSAGDREAVRQS